ncbi:hypothetical protein KAS10_05050, partial [Candidatus Aerophobetes bacterium]|nr:hypothetical protein [Candidatus Aerophobetes bacterium]
MKKRLVIVAALVFCLSLMFATAGYGLEKLGEGITIRFFNGGPPGCPFASVVYKGALQAASDLGADVKYVWSDWNV